MSSPAWRSLDRRFRGAGECASLKVMLGTLWSVLTLPFRILAWVVELLGRLVAFVVGFVFMVIGVALWAGTFFIVGIPLFVFGLLLTLRALG
jgi:hypothetical protein